jgi:hypothetical protein
MTYETFKALWDALITKRPPGKAVPAPISNGMTAATAAALIEYGRGNKSKVNAIRVLLGRAPIA